MRVTLLSDPQTEYAEDSMSLHRCTFHFLSDLGRRGIASINSHFGDDVPMTAVKGDRTEIKGGWNEHQVYHIIHPSQHCDPDDLDREIPSPAQLAIGVQERSASASEQLEALGTFLNQDAPDIPELRRRLGPLMENLSNIGDSAAELSATLVLQEREASQVHWNSEPEAPADELPF